MVNIKSIKEKIVLFLIAGFILMHIGGGIIEILWLIKTGLVWVCIIISFAMTAITIMAYQIYRFFKPI